MRQTYDKLIHAYWLLRIKLQRKNYHATKCGHTTKKIGLWKAFGEERVISAPTKNGTTSYCHKCLEEMAIRCTWCGKPIFPGQSVTLSFSTDPDYRYPDYAVSVGDDDGKSYVGCLRWNCAESGAFFAGFWDVPGRVTRMLSPIDIAFNVAAHGQVVIFNDLSDPKQVARDIGSYLN